MSHSSSYPCPYCITPKGKLSVEKHATNTTKNISENYTQSKKCGSNPKKANKHFNCVNEPLLNKCSDDPIFIMCPPPPLDMLLGIVNAVYKAVEKVDSETATKWVTKSNCQRHSQFGFTCRDCHKLTSNIQILLNNEALLLYHQVILPLNCLIVHVKLFYFIPGSE